MFCLNNVGPMTNFHDNTEKKSQQRRKLQQGKGMLWISSARSSSFRKDDAHVTELSLRLQLTRGAEAVITLPVAYLP